ncbi:putative Ig domain-containing protein [Thalassotalea fonticola]|uniref:Ig domain-containing protein n=1 Tax=Thalassotalea fonticola TaxID=3065649 RepID=A0ABZ0GJH7_9GAMM|nr:putative Ig domain-containing protein [Colwelliaceae bacterium S1-1]
MQKLIQLFIAILLLQTIQACGGGQSDESQPNSAPTVSINLTEAIVGEQFTAKIALFDVDGDALTLTLDNQPQWLSLNQASQTLTGTPQQSDLGLAANIILQVSDGNYTVDFEFNITVLSAENQNNQPPQIELALNSVLAGRYYQFSPETYDADGDVLSLTLENSPAWLHLDAEQQFIYGTPQTADEGQFTDTSLTVSDGYKTAQIQFDINVVVAEPLALMINCEQ